MNKKIQVKVELTKESKESLNKLSEMTEDTINKIETLLGDLELSIDNVISNIKIVAVKNSQLNNKDDGENNEA
ncbi:hypothetical protein [Peptostreptococcus equinus]|uniref:Uncharacterized protein n=1 Tax=Peptostreptococcus equinus TaxID=3003601 RepID=A0ABY7JN15_9FIRM|nr:hypothetical protein [Peptostreptococcus sp. CBA3647]WAW14758.1 hypothetical protein O0R46_09255 [Peptostreptococcus sp. CBA3647]